MNERATQLLEFDRIRDLLARETSFGPGRDAAHALRPSSDHAAVERAQRETTEARYLLDRGHALPLGGLRDIRPYLGTVRSGDLLEPAHLLDIAQTCEGAANLRRFLGGRKENCPTLDLAASEIGLFEELVREIRRCITERAEVSDNASRKLQQIRNSMQTTLGRIRDKLESIIRSAELRKVLQDPIITLRQERYVVPVRAEYKDSLPGVVHDRSASGVTLFVEPLSVVPLNNELRQAVMEEREEIARILRELTDSVARHAAELDRTIRALGHLDLCSAKSRLSARMNAVAPLFDGDGAVDLRQARHPLLRVAPPAKVVPIDIRIGQAFDTVVITGPNTGGKTVTLKTVGLLALMSMAGLHIPAEEGSRVSVFQGVWADIGDEQSIEQNLSTFSSHLQNIIAIITNLKRTGGKGNLVLLDEIGAGTDPVEGAALAMALLDHFHASGARTVATTHYSEIKAFVYERDRMVNASVEFDVETLAPTYRLTIGLPGRSNALEISNRLGLPAEIIDQARGHLTKEKEDASTLIQHIEEDRVRAQEELRVAREAAREAREMREDQARKWANLRAAEEKVIEKAREDARAALRAARMEAAGILGRLRRTEARLAALADGRETGETPADDEPARLAELEAAGLPLDARRRFDRLEQVSRDILAVAEKRVKALSPAADGAEEEAETGAGDVPAGGIARPRAGGRSAAGAGPSGAGVRPERAGVVPGKTFYVAGLRHFGEVLETPDEGGMVGIMVGSMRITVHLSDLRVPGKAGVPEWRVKGTQGRTAAAEMPPSSAGGASSSGAAAGLRKALAVSSEIHLRGLTVEEGLSRLDKYLDDALLAGLETVRVIHGRGTGILRQAVIDYLDEHPDVRAHYMAEPAEGGLGATVVRLGARGDGG